MGHRALTTSHDGRAVRKPALGGPCWGSRALPDAGRRSAVPGGGDPSWPVAEQLVFKREWPELVEREEWGRSAPGLGCSLSVGPSPPVQDAQASAPLAPGAP